MLNLTSALLLMSEKRFMRVVSVVEPLPQPGQQLRWRHPRRAFALGWFNVFGPGPFEFLGVVDEPEPDAPLTFIIQTEFGVKAIDAVWVSAQR
jgi:hypothetical protein